MINWFYLSFGFALLHLFQKGERQPKGKSILILSLELSLAVTLLATLDSLSNHFLWKPVGRGDLRLISLFLGAFLVDQMMNRSFKREPEKGVIPLAISESFLALFSFAFWMVGNEHALSFKERFLGACGLPLGMGGFRWLLVGLKEKLRLSDVPKGLEGAPILFWLAMLLFLAFWGLGNAFVN